MQTIRNCFIFVLFVSGIIFSACTSEDNKWKDLNEKFLENNKSLNGIVTTKSGLQYKVLSEGAGLSPNSSSYVKIIYTGKLIDGTRFDSTINDTTLVHTPYWGYVSYYVTGFQEALTKMKTGSHWEIYIPYSLGYGTESSGTIPAYSTLIFDVQLLGFQ